jgi:Tfp pilus assembly protein PilV
MTLAGRFRARGFTIAEGLIASVVLAASVVGISGTLTASYQQTEVLKQKTEGVSLARQLMEQITACAFNDPEGTVALGPDGTESLTGFDNVHGYSDASTAGGVPTARSALSDPPTSAASYTRSVTVNYFDAPGGNIVESGPFALVTVVVHTPGGDELSISQLMCDYTPAE